MRLTKEQILENINNQQILNYDTVINISQFQADKTLAIFAVVNDVYEKWDFNKFAWQQLLTKIRVPKQFFDRCPIYLQKNIFDYFIGIYNKNLLLRCQKTNNKKIQYVRAVLSENYETVDNNILVPWFFNNLENLKYEVEKFENDDQITSLTLSFPDCVATKNGNTYKAGISLTNSETGYSAVWIEPIVFVNDLILSNRKSLKKQNVNCRVVHKGNITEERIISMIEQCKDIAQVGLIQTIEAFDMPIEKEKAVQFVENIDGLHKKYVDILEEQWNNTQTLTKLQVASEIIKIAESLPLFVRIQINHQASSITGLFNNFKAKMADILEEIE